MALMMVLIVYRKNGLNGSIDVPKGRAVGVSAGMVQTGDGELQKRCDAREKRQKF